MKNHTSIYGRLFYIELCPWQNEVEKGKFQERMLIFDKKKKIMDICVLVRS